MKLRPWRTLHLRTCDKCDKEMLSVYHKDHEGKVYCEECYTSEVYW
jgi:formylmethanofuran dehydrogenase subunit E